MVYQISYDFVGSWTDPSWYWDLEEAIKSYGTWMHVQKSEWFIETDESAAQVHSYLWRYMRQYDRLLVTRVHNEWTVSGLSAEQVQWLRGRSYTSLPEFLSRFFLPKSIPLPKPLPPLPIDPLLREFLEQ